MPYLEHDGALHELPRGDTAIGSGTDVDWRLQTINLAPRHFAVRVEDSGSVVLTPFRAHDVDVNGETLTAPRTLQHNDEIIAGAGIFTFLASLDAPTSAASSQATAYLIDIRAGLAYALADEAVTIGRDPSNQVAVKDPAVSRFHAEVRVTADRRGFALRSMGAGGSSINGVLVGSSARQLSEGDLVRIANTTLRFTTQPPPPILRVVTKADVPAAGARARPSGTLQRAVEGPTLGAPPVTAEHRVESGSERGAWITGALLATGVLLAVLILRALHSH